MYRCNTAVCVGSCVAGQPLGLLQDSSTGALHLWSSEALHEVSISNEDKDMWRIYLEHQVTALLAWLFLSCLEGRSEGGGDVLVLNVCCV